MELNTQLWKMQGDKNSFTSENNSDKNKSQETTSIPKRLLLMRTPSRASMPDLLLMLKLLKGNWLKAITDTVRSVDIRKNPSTEKFKLSMNQNTRKSEEFKLISTRRSPSFIPKWSCSRSITERRLRASTTRTLSRLKMLPE